MEWLLAELRDAVFPPRCFVCGAHAPDGRACAEHALPAEPCGPRCATCCAALPASLPDGERCPDCREKRPGFRRVVALADYRAQPAARAWLLPFKHGGRRELAAPLGAALSARLDVAAPGPRWPRVLVPVPLHVLRRFERGYDQAWLLARAIAAAGGPPAVRALRRVRATPAQGAPGASSRSANVRGAFAPSPRAAERVADAEVWLVDDVVTSGATAAACARELRRMGARNVSVLCVARAGETTIPP